MPLKNWGEKNFLPLKKLSRSSKFGHEYTGFLQERGAHPDPSLVKTRYDCQLRFCYFFVLVSQLSNSVCFGRHAARDCVLSETKLANRHDKVAMRFLFFSL
jgi:hypothetical protein